MNAPARKFDAAVAVRAEVPLLIGLLGPPGGGKTYSALRIATGMAKVRGGDVVLIDTERRANKYADAFKFRRVIFDPPFRPTDFLEAIKQQLPLNPAAIIIDSMSDEHEGEGGVLDWHDRELDRMAGDDWAKRERMTQAAWIKPKRDRIAMINGVNRVMVPLLMCFRAREKTKQIKDDRGKMVPTNIGYQPIAPSEIVHAMDLTCILPPRAEGVPVWKSDKAGEDFIIKLPAYLKPFITEGQPLSEAMGEAFATWAKGGAPSPQAPSQSAPPASAEEPQTGAGEAQEEEGITAHLDRLDRQLAEAAKKGTTALRAAWIKLSGEDRATLQAALDRRHKPAAAKVDKGEAP